MNILKSIGAVLAGLIFIVLTHTGVDRILEGLGIFTQPDQGFHTTWMVATATVYRTILSAAGCFLTGVISREIDEVPVVYAVVPADVELVKFLQPIL